MSEQKAILGLGSKIEAGTRQAFSSIATGFRQIATAMSESAKAMRKVGQEAPAKVFEEAAKSINKLTGGLEGQIKATRDLSKAQSEGIAARKKNEADLVAAQAKATKAQWATNKELEKTADLSVKATAKLKELKAQFHNVINAKGTTGGSAANLFAAYIPKANDMGQLNILQTQLGRLQAGFRDTSTEATKSASSFQKLKSAFPDYSKQIAALSKTTLSYNEQVVVLKRLKTAHDVAAAAQLKKNKDAIAAANLSDKAAASVNNLALKYDKLLSSATSVGASARNVFAKFTPLASDNQKLAELSIRLAKLQASFKGVTTSAEQSARSFQKLKTAFPDYSKQIATLSKTTLSYEEQVAVLKRLIATRAAAEVAAAKSAKSTAAIAVETTKLKRKYEELRVSQDKYGEAARRVLTNIDKYKLSTEKAGYALSVLQKRQDLAARSFTTFGGAIDLVTKKLRSYAGYMVASSAVFAFITGIRSAVSTIATYDQSLKDLQAIVRPTTEELERMATTMKKVANDTKFSAAETAEGMKLLGQAGFDAEDVIAAIPGVTNLATGTLTEMATTVDLVTTAITAFGLQAAETGGVTDIFANAVNKSKLTIEDIKTAMNYIGPAAHNAGMSLDETAGILMVLRNNGLKASTMATGFRQVISKLVAPTQAFKGYVAAAGMSMADFSIESLGISKVLHNLQKVIKDNEGAMKSFGIRGSAVATALVKNVDLYDSFVSMVTRQGAAAEMAAVQLQGLGLMYKNLQDKTKNIWIAMGEGGFTGVLKALVNVGRVLADVITDLANNRMVQLAAQITITVGAAKLLIAAFGWFIGRPAVAAALAAISAGIAAVSAASFTAATAVTGLSAAVSVLRTLVVGNWIALAVTAIGYLAYEYATYSQTLKDTAVQLGVVKDRLTDNISIIKAAEKVFSNTTTTQEQHKEVLDKLIEEYPAFAVALQKAAGNAEELRKVLAAINREQERQLQIKAAEGMENTGKAIEDLSKRMLSYDGSLRKAIQSEEVVAGVQKDFSAEQAKYIQDYIRDGKLRQMTDEEIVNSFTKGLEHMDSARQLFGNNVMPSSFTDGLVEKMKADLKVALDAAANFAKKKDDLLGRKPVKISLDPETVKQEFQEYKEEQETALAMGLLQLEKANAAGSLSDEKYAQIKINKTKETYKQIMDLAISHHAALEKESGVDPEALVAAHKRAQDATQKYLGAEIAGIKRLTTEREKADAIATKMFARSSELRIQQIKTQEANEEISKGAARVAIQKEEMDTIDDLIEKYTELHNKYGENESYVATLNNLMIKKAQLSNENVESVRKEIQAIKDLTDAEKALDLQHQLEKVGTDVAVPGRDTELNNMKQAHELSMQLADLEIAKAQEKFDKISGMNSANDSEVLAAKLRLQDAINEKEVEALDFSRAILAERMQLEEDAWRRGEISAQQYIDTVREAMNKGVIYYEEGRARMMAATDDMFAAFKYGWENWKKDMQSAGESMQEAAYVVGDALTDGVADGLLDVADRTKTAKEAFSELTRSVLKDLAKIYLKMALMGAIEGIGSMVGSMFGSTVPSSGAGLYSASGMNWGGRAEGGLIGGHSPHKKADNIPIMATAKEFVEPVDVVEHYGADVFEAFRQKLIPKDFLEMLRNTVQPPKSSRVPKFADGGLVPTQAVTTPVQMRNNASATGGVNVTNHITVQSGAGGTDQDKTGLSNKIAMAIKREVVDIISQQTRYGGVLYG
jgi:TP901 family phage tail tape measure protein